MSITASMNPSLPPTPFNNKTLQFIVTTICLTCISAVGATCCAWDPGNTFAYMAGFFCLFGSALPGYIGDQVFWNYVRCVVLGF